MICLVIVLPAEEQKASQDPAIWHRGQTDEEQLRKLLEDHHRWTGSKRARDLLDHWADARAKFVKVFPNEYQRALGEIHGKKSAPAPVQSAEGATKKVASAAQ